LKELVKQLVTPEIKRKDSNPHICCEFRGSIRRVLGVRESNPHTAEVKLQMSETCGLCDPARRGRHYVCHLCKKLVSPVHKDDLSHVYRREYIRYLLTVGTEKTKLLFFIYWVERKVFAFSKRWPFFEALSYM
jgi:hypothetical protein